MAIVEKQIGGHDNGSGDRLYVYVLIDDVALRLTRVGWENDTPFRAFVYIDRREPPPLRYSRDIPPGETDFQNVPPGQAGRVTVTQDERGRLNIDLSRGGILWPYDGTVIG